MQLHEIDAWLGDNADQLDTDQKTQLAGIADDLAARYPDAGDAQLAGFNAAAAYLLGDTNAHSAAREYQAAQQRRDETLVAAIQVAAMAGMTQEAAAETIGINRRTVARHLGKA